jgi:hypothetical protein
MNAHPDRPIAGVHAGRAAGAARGATGTFIVKTTKTTT